MKKRFGAVSVLEVTTVASDNILTVKISFPNWTMRVIVAYGPQENDSIEKKEQFFSDLEVEIEAAKVNGDKVFVAGDLNSKIEMVNGEIKFLSSNGKLLMNLVKERKLNVMNFSTKCTGKWTHVIRKSNATSVIDYILVDDEIERSISQVIIDEECFHTPFRKIADKGEVRAQYSDHNTILTKFHVDIVSPKKTQNDETSKSWLLNEEGWKKFKQITSDNSCRIEPDGDSNEEYSKFENYIESVMNTCFKKRGNLKSSDNQSRDEKTIYSILRSFMKKGKTQRKVGGEYIQMIKEKNLKVVAEKRLEKVKKVISSLTVNDQLSYNGFWKLKRSLNLKTEVGTSLVLKNGVEVFGTTAIREAYKEEFMYRLRNRTISPHLKGYEDLTNTLCQIYQEVGKQSNSDLVFNRSDLIRVIKSISHNKAPGPDGLPAEVFIHAGESLLESTVDIFNNIKRNACIPIKWNKVLIKTLYKNKGSVKDLENHRGIFLTPAVCKIFERYLITESKENIENINKCQAGSRPNRSTSDQLFLIRACIDHAKYTKITIYFRLYDFKQCFDGMWLEDSIISLKSIGISDEILSLIKSMNTMSDIIVKTPVGNTTNFIAKNIVRQGTVIGPLLCSASTAECCNDHKKGGMSIGTTSIRSLAYVDDILDVDVGPEDVSDGHDTVLTFTSKKRLELSWKKCALLVIRPKKNTKIPNLLIDEKQVKREKSAKYLGDIINEKGSYSELVEERVRNGNFCSVNTFAMVQEITFGYCTIQTLLLLYNTQFLTSVLYNAQTWSCMTNSEMKKLKVCQMSYLKRVLKAPTSTPNAVVLLELGILPIEFEVYKKKLMFLLHILTLDSTDPVYQVYHEQRKYEYEQNWANEVEKLKQSMQIDDTNESIKTMSKYIWKKIVGESTKAAARQKLSDDCKTLKKVTRSYDELTIKEYFFKLPVEDARTVFAYRSGTLDLKCNKRWKYEDTLCRACSQSEENLNHVINDCCMCTDGDSEYLDTESEDMDIMTNIVRRIKTFTLKILQD